ncbi:MAG: lipocalin family protein [Steroidobacteraceae bacterium]
MRKSVFLGLLLMVGCASMSNLPLPHAASVDIPKFMGSWYVIASIPTRPEKDAYGAVENYKLSRDGTIATTFTFRKGGPDGKEKVMQPKGFVRDDPSNAIWGMQFFWPIKSEYVIAHVDPAYQETIIARSKRDYVWIMARAPQLADADYSRLVAQVRGMGYDTGKLVRVPQGGKQGPTR